MSTNPSGDSPESAQTALAAHIARGRVVCLCAQWCDLCRDYRMLFDDAAARHPALDFRWIDIEDEAELAGDMEVETFPTLVVADQADRLVFAGPLSPQPGVLERLLLSAAEPGRTSSVEDVEASALLARLLGQGSH
jgi:thioredoxin 1